MGEQRESDRPNVPGRKPYRTPTVNVFGSLADLTANVGATSNMDGGGGTMMRSQP